MRVTRWPPAKTGTLRILHLATRTHKNPTKDICYKPCHLLTFPRDSRPQTFQSPNLYPPSNPWTPPSGQKTQRHRRLQTPLEAKPIHRSNQNRKRHHRRRQEPLGRKAQAQSRRHRTQTRQDENNNNATTADDANAASTAIPTAPDVPAIEPPPPVKRTPRPATVKPGAATGAPSGGATGVAKGKKPNHARTPTEQQNGRPREDRPPGVPLRGRRRRGRKMRWCLATGSSAIADTDGVA